MTETEWIIIRDVKEDDEVLKRAGRILALGGLVAFPTETVYGLGGDAKNPGSSKAIYAAKGRPSDNPLIVHICDINDLKNVALDVPDEAYRLAERFWPGPLTMILKKHPDIPVETTGGLDTVAVRFPDNEIALALIRYAGGFVAAPSANTSGRPSPTVGKYVYEDLAGKVDMILDGGSSVIGLESTIIDLTDEIPMVLRPGYITLEMLREVLPDTVLDPGIAAAGNGAGHKENGTGNIQDHEAGITGSAADAKEGLRPKAPGMKYRHYAPKGKLILVDGDEDKALVFVKEELKKRKAEGKRTGLILYEKGFDPGEGFTDADINEEYKADSVKIAGDSGGYEDLARDVFRFLREFDDEKIDYIYARVLPESGLGLAIMNRLKKAAGGNIVHL